MRLAQTNRSTLFRDRAGRCLQDCNDTQTRCAIRDRSLAGAQTVDKVLDLGLQSLLRRDVRRPHIPSPITDPELMCLVRRTVQRDALVINLDLLRRFDVVIYNHLTTAADKRLPDLDG